MSKKEINWKYEIGQRIIDYNEDGSIKRDLTITDRKIEIIQRKDNRKQKGFVINNMKLYKYNCNLCGFDCGEHYRGGKYKKENWIEERSLNKNSCLYCTNQITIKGMNDITTTHPHLLKYFKNIEDTYTHSFASNDEVWMICPDCRREKFMKISTISKQGFGCNICGDGEKYPNKFMFKLLNQMNICFEREYSPEWIKPKRYDFYIPSLNLIIEMDGRLGHGKHNYLSGQFSEESKFIDDEKDRLANEHGIEVIRIDCKYNDIVTRFNYIKDEIINHKRFNQIFNINYINFDACDKYSLSNLVKIACEYKNNNSNLTSAEIGKLMGGYCTSTVIKWLKIGEKQSWCKYNASEEKIKNSRKNGINNNKPMKCNDNNMEFNSIRECCINSLAIFGVQLQESLVSMVCRNERKTHKGYSFEFIN